MDLTYGAVHITQSGLTQRIRYQEFSHPARQAGPCPVCGKRRTRSRTFTATQSPFNVDPATGQPRTAQQITRALAAEAAAWSPDFSCSSHLPPRCAPRSGTGCTSSALAGAPTAGRRSHRD